MAGSFKVACPSCENLVLVTNQKSGSKIECPKCKYRFKAEPPSDATSGEAKAAKDGKSGKDKTAKDKAAKSPKAADPAGKKVTAIAVGAVGVIVLVIGGFVFLASGGGTSGGSGTNLSGGFTPPPAGPGPAPTPEGEPTNTDGKKTPTATPPKTTFPPSDKDERATTNLLPPDSMAVYRFAIDQIRNTSPINILLDRTVHRMVVTAFGMELPNIQTYYHAYVGSQRLPFGIIRLASPEPPAELARNIAGLTDPTPINGRVLHRVSVNPLIQAVAHSLTFRNLFGALFAKMPASTLPVPRPYGVCVYDSQHILIGDYELMQQYLQLLDARGLPPQKTQQAENPMYLSIDPELKRLLKSLGAENERPPMLLFVDRITPEAYQPLELTSDYELAAPLVQPLTTKTRYFAACLEGASTRHLTGRVRLSMNREADAVEMSRDVIVPTMTFAAPLLSKTFETAVNFTHPTGSGGNTGTPGYPFPMPPGGFPMPPGGFPMPPGGYPMPPGAPPGGLTPPGVPPDEGGEIPPGTPGIPGYPNFPGQTGKDNKKEESYIQLTVSDADIVLQFHMRWNDEVYRQVIWPPLERQFQSIRGRFAAYASVFPMQTLREAVLRYTQRQRQFPPGTIVTAGGEGARFGLKRPPRSRVSLFYELLNDLGHDDIRQRIDVSQAWHDEKNLSAAEAWIPALLYPHYPQEEWRAVSPLVPVRRSVGATHFVAIAGIGQDAARYNPKDPAYAKKVGITGYEWGSHVDEITDGLDKTIYMMLAAPGLSQPWIAGGGATVRGLDEKDPLNGFRHTFGTPDGQPGTYALMADGSIRFIPATIDPKILLAMATRAGGEPLPDLDHHAPLIFPKRERPAEPPPQPPAGKTNSDRPQPSGGKANSDSPPQPSPKPSAPPTDLPVAPPPRPIQ